MYTVFIVSKRSRVGRRVGVMVSAVAVVAATMSAVIGAPPASAAPSGPSGTVVSTEPLPARITVPGAVNAKRITYWTKGVRDAAALSSGAVYLPPGTPPKGGWPVIAWAHGTTGLADHCAYSIGGPVAVERDWDYLGSWMSKGYAVVASECGHIGLPVWDEASRRITGLEPIPLDELGRPRIDVTVRISGFFRDAFPHVVTMLDDAVTLAAGLDDLPLFAAIPAAEPVDPLRAALLAIDVDALSPRDALDRLYELRRLAE